MGGRCFLLALLAGGCEVVFPPGHGPPGTDAPACELPGGCTAGNAFVCGDHCYIACADTTTAAAAATACETWGGALAAIADIVENECVAEQLVNVSVPRAWIGLAQSAASDVAANWRWNGAEPISFVAWQTSSEPNDSDGFEDGEEQCGFTTSAGGWADVACDDPATQLPRICER